MKYEGIRQPSTFKHQTSKMIDTHAHLDGPEYSDDRAEMIQRAKDAGVSKVFIPAIDLRSVQTVTDTCRQFPGYAYPMIGLHPEEVKADYREVLAQMKQQLADSLAANQTPPLVEVGRGPTPLGEAERGPTPLGEAGRGLRFIAIGEVGLDYYWSREFEKEQLEAFEEQVRWAVEFQLPLMIHCRKAQNEMVAIIKKYQNDLPGGVFHCFTGNEHEAAELLQFDKFVLGIGGVSTFKKSHLPEVLPAVVPLDRIVLETDAPYMAPVPKRGERNEPAFVAYVLKRLAEAYGVSEEEVAQKTNENVARVLGIIL